MKNVNYEIIRRSLENHAHGSHIIFIKTITNSENVNVTLWNINENAEKCLISFENNKVIVDCSEIEETAKKVLENDILKQHKIEKVEKNMNIEKIELTVENDFYEAERILEVGSVTEMISPWHAYNKRVDGSKKFVGIYPVKVERMKDFERVEFLIANQITSHKNPLRKELERKVYKFHERGLMSTEEARKELQEVWSREVCTCKLCSFTLSFDEWKSGKMSNGSKVGKSMRKAGIYQSTIDLYSLQSKEEKDSFLVVSDRVQHITGMSYYSTGEWDGYGENGFYSSCQDPRHDYDECNRLAGSLHDNKLLVGFMIDSLEDLKDMEEKMLARTVFRYLEVDGVSVLQGTKYYGNNDTKDLLHNALLQVEKYGIFSKEAHEGSTNHEESTNGRYDIKVMDEIEIDEEFENYEWVTCPMCSGNGNYEAYSSRAETYVNIECPSCSGDGQIEHCISTYVETTTEVEVIIDTVIPYNEGYRHRGDYMSIWIDKEYMFNKLGLGSLIEG